MFGLSVLKTRRNASSILNENIIKKTKQKTGQSSPNVIFVKYIYLKILLIKCFYIHQDDEVVNVNKDKSASLQSPLNTSNQLTSETPYTVYAPSQAETQDPSEPTTMTKELLNAFLEAREISPIRTRLSTPWEESSQRTKRRYSRKAKQVILAALEELAPNSPNALLSTVHETSSDEDYYVDKSLMEALVEC